MSALIWLEPRRLSWLGEPAQALEWLGQSDPSAADGAATVVAPTANGETKKLTIIEKVLILSLLVNVVAVGWNIYASSLRMRS